MGNLQIPVVYSDRDDALAEPHEFCFDEMFAFGQGVQFLKHPRSPEAS